MHLREGVVYVSRDGRKRGPIQYRSGNARLPFFVKEGSKIHSWSSTGRFYADGRDAPEDIVAEWIDDRPAPSIDQVDISYLQRGVAKLFDMGRLY